MSNFWTEKHTGDLKLIDHIQQESVDWIDAHKYEIENYWTALDWLKVYADAILDQDLSMNSTLLVSKENDSSVNARPLLDDEWKEMASVARYIANLRESLGKFEQESMPGLSMAS